MLPMYFGPSGNASSQVSSTPFSFFVFESESGILKLCISFFPGGVLLLGDGNRDLFDDKKERLPPADLSPGAENSGRSWFSAWLIENGSRKADGGRVPPPGEDQPALVRADGQFEILGERDYYIPMGWDGGDIPYGAELSKMWTLNLEVRPLGFFRLLSTPACCDWRSVSHHGTRTFPTLHLTFNSGPM